MLRSLQHSGCNAISIACRGALSPSGRRSNVTCAALFRRSVSAADAGIDLQDALRDWEPTLSGEEGLLASYADVCRATTRAAAAQRGARAGGTLLRDIMCRQEELICATPEMFVTDAAQLLARVGGVPVVVGDGSMRLVGVLCRSDLESRQGFHVQDVMAQLPLELGPDDSVTSAACLMLKHKVRRVPVVDREFNCIGIVTATDVWVAMAVDSGADSRNLDML